MATRVLDSWALMALFMDQTGAEQVENILIRAEAGKDRLLLSAVNWGEIYYSIHRAVSKEAAEAKSRDIAAMPIQIMPINDDLELVRQAAIFKATKRMAYADCFAAALAKLNNAELITGDEEFREVSGEIKVHWLR